MKWRPLVGLVGLLLGLLLLWCTRVLPLYREH